MSHEVSDSSALSRLFALVECAESPITRRISGEQIALFLVNYPGYFDSVVEKCQVLLFSKLWDTRIAAGATLGAIARRLPSWSSIIGTVPLSDAPVDDAARRRLRDHYALSFSEFNIDDVFSRGVRLLGSSGKVYILL